MRYSKGIAPCAVVIAASGAAAAPFTLQSVSTLMADGGSPIQISSGAYFQHNVGSDTAPGGAQFGAFPSLEFDSYVTISGPGPTTTTYDAPAVSITPGGGFAGGALEAGWFLVGGSASQINPHSGFDAVFIARLAVPTGVLPMSEGVTFQAMGEPVETQPLTLQGSPPKGDGGGKDGGRVFKVNGYQTGFNIVLNANAKTGAYDVWDIYVEDIPAPGVASLLGLAGLAGCRRRRG